MRERRTAEREGLQGGGEGSGVGGPTWLGSPFWPFPHLGGGLRAPTALPHAAAHGARGGAGSLKTAAHTPAVPLPKRAAMDTGLVRWGVEGAAACGGEDGEGPTSLS